MAMVVLITNRISLIGGCAWWRQFIPPCRLQFSLLTWLEVFAPLRPIR